MLFRRIRQRLNAPPKPMTVNQITVLLVVLVFSLYGALVGAIALAYLR